MVSAIFLAALLVAVAASLAATAWEQPLVHRAERYWPFLRGRITGARLFLAALLLLDAVAVALLLRWGPVSLG